MWGSLVVSASIYRPCKFASSALVLESNLCLYIPFPPTVSRCVRGIFATDAKISKCAEWKIRLSHLHRKQRWVSDCSVSCIQIYVNCQLKYNCCMHTIPNLVQLLHEYRYMLIAHWSTAAHTVWVNVFHRVRTNTSDSHLGRFPVRISDTEQLFWPKFSSYLPVAPDESQGSSSEQVTIVHFYYLSVFRS